MAKLLLLLALTTPAWAQPWFLSYVSLEQRLSLQPYIHPTYGITPVDTLFACFPSNQSYAGKITWDYTELGIEKEYVIPFFLEKSPYGACGYWTVDPAVRPQSPITVFWAPVGDLDFKDYPKP